MSDSVTEQTSAGAIAAAARRGALQLAQDPTMRHYTPETLALVYERTVVNLAGAGDLLKAAERMESDPKLVGVPIEVVADIMGASFKHFARSLSPAHTAQENVQ